MKVPLKGEFKIFCDIENTTQRVNEYTFFESIFYIFFFLFKYYFRSI